MRQIILDTETTGLDPKDGHRIIEIGCIEVIDRRLTGNDYHQYIQPQRKIDRQAVEVHGITEAFLADKPLMHEIVPDFVQYIKGAELVIHNADFDTGFLDHEFSLLDDCPGCICEFCGVTDTLQMARKMYPGQRVSLDALCKRLEIDNSGRDLHGALLDARLLAEVYLAMTGGQVSLLGEATGEALMVAEQIRRVNYSSTLPVLVATKDELSQHSRVIENMKKDSDSVIWSSFNDEDQLLH